jgi:hypothetical protein
MLELDNKDSSFFTIESPDIELSGHDFSKHLKSLSITEKTASMPQGSLIFNDPDNFFSRVLRTGVRLNISWGYRDLKQTPDSLIAKKLNFDEVSGSMIRRGYQGFVSSPTGGGGKDGTTTFSCNFSAFGFRGVEESKTYETGTKRTVIDKAFNDIGVSPTKRLIKFTLENDKVTKRNSVRQDETTFAFLVRLGVEWNAMFHIAFSPEGEPVGFFIDNNMVGNTSFPLWVLKAGGVSNSLGYKGELNNVISYTWTSSESESGVGDNVRLDIVNGQIIYRRYQATEEKVITYRLDQDKIQDVYNNASDGGITQQLKLTKELLSKKDFESVKHFFTPVEQSTAPNGYGYRINAKMLGNPLFSPGNQIKINNGFPDRLGGKQSKWYIHEVTHTVDTSGYMMDVSVVDVFNLSPIGLPIR